MNYSPFLSKISENNSKIEADNVKHILILNDINMFYIGDTCIQTARLRKTAKIYKNASIDLNTCNTKHYQLIGNITKHNPYISNYYNLQWDQIDFTKYDLIICGCIPELSFLEFLHSKYAEAIFSGSMITAFFSVSGNVGFDEKRYGVPVFPVNLKFNDFKLSDDEEALIGANELFISDSEFEWSADWLKKHGLGPDDHLVIFLDSSSVRSKLLMITDYFDILKAFLGLNNIKVLIFDEASIGKKDFYEHWLGPELSARLIFAEKTSLREAICLVGSKRTKVIFGPSTGLLHCASGVFNVLLQNGYSKDLVPMMIGYVGNDIGNQQEDQWWGKSLVDIVLPIKKGNSKELRFLKDVNFDQVFLTNRLLGSQEISSLMLIDFIKNNCAERLNKLEIKMDANDEELIL